MSQTLIQKKSENGRETIMMTRERTVRAIAQKAGSSTRFAAADMT